MACSFFGTPCQLHLLAGREHGRTIPLADISERGFFSNIAGGLLFLVV